MAEFLNFLTRMVLSLKNSQLNYVIVGGLTAIIRGRTRTTQDVDLIIENNLKRIDTFFQELLKQDFDVSSEQIKYSIQEGFNLSVFDKKSALRLDIKIAKKEEDINALEQSVSETYQGLSLKLVTIEQFLYGKIIYLGDISDISDENELLEFNDVIDFLTIMRLYKDSFDLERLKMMVNRAKLGKTLNRLLKIR